MTGCECADPRCLYCGGKCRADQPEDHVLLYKRYDMENCELWMCIECADDAIQSGLHIASAHELDMEE